MAMQRQCSKAKKKSMCRHVQAKACKWLWKKDRSKVGGGSLVQSEEIEIDGLGKSHFTPDSANPREARYIYVRTSFDHSNTLLLR